MDYHIYMDTSLFVLTQEELMQWIFDEKLKPSAKIQKAEERDWQNLSETPEWNLFYGSENEEKDWILLKKSSEKKSFRQKGPYSTRQVCRFLEMGLCFSWDFIWTKGFKEWKRISLVSELSTHPGHTIEDILTQQNRQYKDKKAKMVRYSPSRSFLDWFELKKVVVQN